MATRKLPKDAKLGLGLLVFFFALILGGHVFKENLINPFFSKKNWQLLVKGDEKLYQRKKITEPKKTYLNWAEYNKQDKKYLDGILKKTQK